MAFVADAVALLDRLDEKLRLARAPTLDLFAEFKTFACPRLSALSKSVAAAHLEGLIAGAAWTEAAINFIELEMPAWKLRRVIRENGEWYCSLSRQPSAPIELDDMAEASHEILALAILRAFVAARCRGLVAPQAIAVVPRIRSAPEPFVCCSDNYA